MNRIYLDNSATTQVHPEVAEIMTEYMVNQFGNPSSAHTYGQKAKYALDDAREKVADVINARYEEIYFTSGGTESDNWAVRGVVNSFADRIESGRRVHIITTDYEHPAVLTTCEYLSTKVPGHKFVDVTYIKPDKNGVISPEKIEEAINEDTVLVSVMHINSEIGAINDIERIGKICEQRKIVFHIDAVQSFTKKDIDVKKLNINLLSASAHKIHGPKGIGMLYVRKNTKIEPIMYGGHQENQYRMGTENLPGIVGFGKACEIAKENPINLAELKEKKIRLYEIIKKEVPDVVLNGDLEEGFEGILNLTFEGVEGEALALSLDMQGIAVSTGSACSTGSVNPSRTLLSIGLSPEQAQSSIRISLDKSNTLEEMETAGKAISDIVNRLKSMAGF